MNIKIKPPCKVGVKGCEGEFNLRGVVMPSMKLKHEKQWGGLVAYVQNERGTGVVEYNRLQKIDEL